MTPLGHQIARRIAAGGPITIADYMAECLLDPVHGYYTTRDPLGTSGDFTTAPEISQMFGELIALALAQAWMDQGHPSPFALVEIGPGRGTLMADILRTLAGVPGMAGAARIHLIEASPVLRARQRERLEGHAVIWSDSIADLPDLPLFLVANEFFDALPIRQFERTVESWSERMVGVDEAGRLAFGRAPASPVALLSARLADTRPGDIVEVCPALPAIAGEIGARIARSGGAAIIVDYGGWRSLGNTFQAVRDHRATDPLADPGAADLTAHVDFEALARAFAAAGAQASAMIPQGVFLQRLGIAVRAERLAQGLADGALESHLAAFRRLTDPGEMGQVFKIIACTAADAPMPPGLDNTPCTPPIST